jgi:hypothetical protein
MIVEDGYMFTIAKRNKRALELVRITYLERLSEQAEQE